MRGTVLAMAFSVALVCGGCGDLPDESSLTEPPETSILVVRGTNRQQVPTSTLGKSRLQQVLDEIDHRTGDAYRDLSTNKKVTAEGLDLLRLAYSGPALRSQRASFRELAAGDSLAADPLDPAIMLVAVQEETSTCAVASVRVDDRGLYAFPDTVVIQDAVLQLRAVKGVWKIDSLVESGTQGAAELGCGL